MNVEKTVLIYDSVKYFIPFIEEKGIKCFPSFKTVTNLEKVFRKLSLSIGLFKKEWYGAWKNHLADIEVVVVFATNRYDFIEYLADNYPQIRIIVWFWNPVFRCFDPNNLKRKNIEYWSFDKDDCEKYNLQYNTTFYFSNISVEKLPQKQDVLFLGADKGRKAALTDLKKRLGEKGVSTHFHIVPDKNSPNPDRISPIGYDEYLMLMSKFKGILDYIQIGQAGLTLRPMESIFLEKKLITNDPNIINEDFYDSSNIFVFGHDDFDRILEFIQLPYREINQETVNKYDFINWLKRFDSNE